MHACSPYGSYIEPLSEYPAKSEQVVKLDSIPKMQKASLPYACGPEAADTILRYWKKTSDLEQITNTLMDPEHPEYGTNSIRLLSFFREQGLNARLMIGNWELIVEAIRNRYVPIATVNLARFPPGFYRMMEKHLDDHFHFYPIVGFVRDPKAVIVQDPGGLRAIRWSLFKRMWIPADRYFLLVWKPGHTPNPKGTGETKELFNRGVTYEQKGKLIRAQKLYNRVINKNPFFPDGLAGMGNIHMQKGNYKKAETYLRKALLRDPSMYRIQNNLAWVLIKQNHKLKEARKRVDFAIETSASRIYSIHRADPLQGMSEKAKNMQSDLRNLLVEAYHTRGLLNHKEEKHSAAVSDFQQSLMLLDRTKQKRNSFRAELHQLIGKSLNSLGRHSEAMVSYLHALEKLSSKKKKERARVRIRIADVHMEMNNYNEALRNLRTARSLSESEEIRNIIEQRLKNIQKQINPSWKSPEQMIPVR